MKPARIQKVKGIEQNIFLQLLNEQSISIILVFLFAVGLFYYFPSVQNGHKVGMTIFFGLAVYFVLSKEIEGQKLYSLAPKLISYIYRPQRLEKLSDLEFLASNEILVLKDRIVTVFSIIPIDYALLHPDEQEQFVNQITTFLNNLKQEHIQLIVKNRKATPKDYLAHFDSVDSSMSVKVTSATQQRREKHLEGYKQNLEELIAHNIIPIREYFLMAQEYCDTSSKEDINIKIQSINDKTERLKRGLFKAQIIAHRLKDTDLELFCYQQFQYN